MKIIQLVNKIQYVHQNIYQYMNFSLLYGICPSSKKATKKTHIGIFNKNLYFH